MKLMFILFFMILPAWSSVQLELDLATSSPKQGEIVPARLILKNAQGQSALAGLKGKNFKKVLYLLNLSPFIGKNGQLEAEAKVIFLKVPETPSVSEVINGQEVVVGWGQIQVVPTEASQSFLLGDFEIPERKKVLLWALLFVALCAISAGVYWLRQKFVRKNQVIKKRKELKQDLLNGVAYADVVTIWQKKRIFVTEFPEIESAFKKLENTLFKYQFKPTQSSEEMKEVMTAYDHFKSEIMGVLNGI